MANIFALQEAAEILEEGRKRVACGSLAVWLKVGHAADYINKQIEEELADTGNDPLFTVDIGEETTESPLDEKCVALANGHSFDGIGRCFCGASEVDCDGYAIEPMAWMGETL